MAFKRRDWHTTLVIVLFLFVFLSRLYFSFQSPYFSNESYYNLRQVEHIAQTGMPLYQDPLSYSGREYYFPPLFHYILATTSLIIPLEWAAKIIPSLISSILVLLVYGIAFKMTRHKGYSFLSAFFFSFTPVAYIHPINEVTPYSLALPIFFGIIYMMMDINENLYFMLLLIIALVLTHPSAFLLVLGLIFYLMLLKVEGMKVEKKSQEVIIFTMFLVFWALFVMYKKAFLSHGMGAAWLNLPDNLLNVAFPTLSVFQVVYFVGMVPLLLGCIGIFVAVFRNAKKEHMLLLGISIAILILLWLNFLRLTTGLLFLTILLSILSAQGLKSRSDYVKKTKFSKGRRLTILSLVFFFLLSSVAPLYSSAMQKAGNVPSQTEIDALQWIRNNTAEDAVVLAPLSQGHLVTYFANRKNVMDTNFVMVEGVNQKFRDTRRIYTYRIKSEALRTVSRYDVDYIFLSQVAEQNYDVEELYYADKECFPIVYNETVKIYKVQCRYQGDIE